MQRTVFIKDSYEHLKLADFIAAQLELAKYKDQHGEITESMADVYADVSQIEEYPILATFSDGRIVEFKEIELEDFYNTFVESTDDFIASFGELDVNSDMTNAHVFLENKRLQFMKDNGISVKGISDGYHTFDELYYHRAVLFSLVCKANKEHAWKSRLHSDGTMWDGLFIVGITTPEGNYTYHYHDERWDMFDVKELEKAPEYDGHLPSDIGRLFSLYK